jgi:magnesium chelatase accessory protein
MRASPALPMPWEMFMAAPPLDWECDGPTWPNADLSRFVEAEGIRWHVQMAGAGPVLLLVHGTAASTHSWRALIRPLAARFTVVGLDLPGHGFTSAPPAASYSLPAMARAIGGLMGALGVEPALAAGHSAGAAILARMALDGHLAARAIVSFNGAFLPFGGWAGQLFAPVARLIALSPFVPRLFAARGADPSAVRRLIGGTGSRLDDEGIALYGRLMRDAGHVRGAISMMAGWDLAPLARDLPHLPCRLALVVGDRDRSIPPHQARVVARLAPETSITVQHGLGHLSHEERPDEAVGIVVEEGVRAGLVPP